MIHRISKLDDNEKVHILNVIKKYNVVCIKNTNGYFIDLLNIDNNIINEIYNCLLCIENNRNNTIINEINREKLLYDYKNLLNNKLQQSLNRKKDVYINKIYIANCVKNIVCNIKYHNKINRKILQNDDTGIDSDIDILYKNSNKTKKYKENSIYHRIDKKCKLLQSISNKFKLSNVKLDAKHHNEEELSEELPEEISEEISEELSEESPEELPEEELPEEELPELEELPEEELPELDEELDPTDIINNQNDEEIDKTDITYEIDETNTIDKNEIIVKEIIINNIIDENIYTTDFTFYKNLLHNNGYNIDYDKNCILKYQPYIKIKN